MRKPHRPLIRITLISLLLVIAITWLAIAIIQIGHKPPRSPHPSTHAHSTKQLTHHLITPKSPWTHITIQPNDSLSHLFLTNHLGYNQVNAVLQQPLAKPYLLNLQPKHELRLQIKNGVLSKAEYDIDNTKTLHITNIDNTLTTTISHKKLTKKNQNSQRNHHIQLIKRRQ